MGVVRMKAYLAIELGNILLHTILGRHVSQAIKKGSLNRDKKGDVEMMTGTDARMLVVGKRSNIWCIAPIYQHLLP